MTRLLIGMIRAYQRYVSVVRPARCKFYPSCSSYAVEAVELHGPGRGLWLAIRRLSRCHPFHRGGVDLVPAPRTPRLAVPAGVSSGADR